MTVCDWVDWCAREGEIEVELSHRAGTERMVVCRLHLAAAKLYGYRELPHGRGVMPGRPEAVPEPYAPRAWTPPRPP